jgi:hypothetical protein
VFRLGSAIVAATKIARARPVLLSKRPASEADHSPPSAEVNNEWNYTSPIARVFTACAGTMLVENVGLSYNFCT